MSGRGVSGGCLRLVLGAAACCTLVAPARVRAQAGEAGERRGTIALGVGTGGPLADAVTGGCGTAVSLSATAGVRWRVRRALIVDATTTWAGGGGGNDCLTIDRMNPDGSHLRTEYERNPDDGTTAAALRTGLEGGTRWVRGRALVGLGRMLQQRVTYRTATLSGSLGPRAARLRVDVEGWWYRLPVRQSHFAVVDGQWVGTPTGPSRRVGERTISTRVGVDVPFGSRH